MIHSATLRRYYALTKPGIVYGNSLAVFAGYVFGARGSVSLAVLSAVLVGAALVIASACVANNIIDKDIDVYMKRTKKRSLVVGDISVYSSLLYSIMLLVLGSLLLYFGTNLVAMFMAWLGWFFYVAVYTPLKRKTMYGTAIGAISGATPPVIGYAAATGSLDVTAALLFAILAVWQMPHFYAIAVYRVEEYKQAKIPVWSVVKGLAATRRQIILYTLLFVPAVVSLYVFSYASASYLVVMLAASLWWLYKVVRPVAAHNYNQWARGVFGASLYVLLAFCFIVSVQHWLP